jgi:hypothetical protein
VIASVNDFLKNICRAGRSRNRGAVGFLVNLLAALPAFSFLPHNPSVRGFDNEWALPLFA